ncbi:MAG: homogentisate phytyltransferase [Candidatus Tectomicrobia bacterium]
MKWLRAFVSFSRLHTIIGTSLSVVGLYVIALAHTDTGQAHLGTLLLTLISCLAANIYIVGLNQLTDVAIDRINKPYLPLASGMFSMRMGWTISLICLLLSLLIALEQGRYLIITVVLSLIIGTAYSVPPIRLKRFPVWSGACIFVVRGAIVNVFLFLHFHFRFAGAATIPIHVWTLTAFIFGLSMIIAWFKDLPDMEGDRLFHIRTLSLRLGPQRVFSLGRGVLAACYGGVIAAGIVGLPGVNRIVFLLSHVVLLAAMWGKSLGVEPSRKASAARYYQFIWVLFFSEYVFFAASCVFA